MAEAIAIERQGAGSLERVLVASAQAGDVAAFEALVGPRLERLLRLAKSIMTNEADASDAVQEGCLRAWRELTHLREADRFEAWLWRIVINACRTSLRGRHRLSIREIAVDALPLDGEPISPASLFVEHVSSRDAIRRAFRRLDPDRRAILVLHHVEERSISEIAVLLAIPEGTAKWRLHAARQALERALEAER